MPQLIKNGPNIPEQLLYDHEDGKVIFFCGAGISMPSGLPDYLGLVDKIYKELNIEKNLIEQEAYKMKQYDRVLHFLEKRNDANRSNIRALLYDILRPIDTQKNDKATHKALLKLSTSNTKDQNGIVRLVTTNYDHLFKDSIPNGQKIDIFFAPCLPIPKFSLWNGIVHLHGILPEKKNDTIALNNLILTSGDFGRAYLTERWASRFVSELFQYYTICFVGYSIDDPILRYMMDALAADEMLGEKNIKAYAFASCNTDITETAKKIEETWRYKGVEPILYKSSRTNHTNLHKTLTTWASLYEDGNQGKRMIIERYAKQIPASNYKNELSVGQVMWALSDKATIKYFTTIDPSPPIEWLGPLTEMQLDCNDLSRHGFEDFLIKHDRIKKYKNIKFSFLSRPFPPLLDNDNFRMRLLGSGQGFCWDKSMGNFACWLLKSLYNPYLIKWVIKNGTSLNYEFQSLVITELLKNKPKTPIENSILYIWHLFLTNRIKTDTLYDVRIPNNIFKLINRDGFTNALKTELLYLLTPCFTFTERFTENDEPEKIKHFLSYDIKFRGDGIYPEFKKHLGNKESSIIMPFLIDELTAFLHDISNLMQEFGDANADCDISYIQRPSIGTHTQNRNFHEWTLFIELIINSWEELIKIDTDKANIIAERWMQIPYPIFKRLAFYAATFNDVISEEKAIKWLLEKDGYWLWCPFVQREVLRLIVNIGSILSLKNANKLINKILEGPTRSIYKKDINDERFEQLSELSILLLLSKLKEGKCNLAGKARTKFEKLSAKYPTENYIANDQCEFPFWMGTNTEPYYDVTLPPFPETIEEQDKWLSQEGNNSDEEWENYCKLNMEGAIAALQRLQEKRKLLFPNFFSKALYAWSQEGFLEDSWGLVKNIIIDISDDNLKKIAHSVARWLNQISQKIKFTEEKIFLKLCERLLTLDYEEDFIVGTIIDVSLVINHSIGMTSEALINYWHQTKQDDDAGINSEIRQLFEIICGGGKLLIYGRIVLALHIVSLYYHDKAWTEKFLLSKFIWDTNDEAAYMWKSFLFRSDFYFPILIALKENIVLSVDHLEKLGNLKSQYSSLVTFILLDNVKFFTKKDENYIFNNLPPLEINTSLEVITRAIKAVDENKRFYYWQNRAKPIIKIILSHYEQSLTYALVKLCLVDKQLFSDICELIVRYLTYSNDVYSILDMIHREIKEGGFNNMLELEQGKHMLTLINKLVPDNPGPLFYSLQKCLDIIKASDSSLTIEFEYKRLLNIHSVHGTTP